jgi:tetratricopeptide (TPR) repeat protein/CHAT domain-containing protein
MAKFVRVVAALFVVIAVNTAALAARQNKDLVALDAKWNEFFQAGNYAEAALLAERWLSIREKTLGRSDPAVAWWLNSLARAYHHQGRYREAEPLYKQSLAIYEKARGRDHPEVAIVVHNLGGLYAVQGRYADAELFDKRSLAMREKLLGRDHPDVAQSLYNLASLYMAQGRYADAEPLYKRSLAIREKRLGRDHRNTADSLGGLVTLYEYQGRYTEAEPLAKRALTISEKVLGPDHPDVASVLGSLAAFYRKQGRFTDAEPLYKRSLAIQEMPVGRDNPDLAWTLHSLASLYRDQGRHADAEPLYKRALAIRERVYGPDHANVAWSMNALALLYRDEGRYADAEPIFRRSLTMLEKALGLDHPDLAGPINNLAGLYQFQRRYVDAEPLFTRSLAIFEKGFGPDHPDVARALNNLTVFYKEQGRYAEAELYSRHSLRILEKAVPNHPDIAALLSGVAELYRKQGRYAEAEPLFERSLAIWEKVLGADHASVGAGLHEMAALYQDQRRYGEAEALYKRSYAILEKALGSGHPSAVESFSGLASLYRDQSRYAEALPIVQKALVNGKASSSVALPVLFGAQRESLISADNAMDDGLNVVQRDSQTSAAAAIGKLGVRLAAGNDRLARLVRKDQDLASESDALDKAIITAVSKEPSKRDAATEQRMKDRLAAIGAERATLQKMFASEFPDYTALSNPLPLTVKKIQALLSDDEALVLFSAASDKETYVLGVTRESFVWDAIPLGAEALSQKVAAFRRGLAIDKIGSEKSSPGKTALFDLGLANELYAALLAPVETLLNDKKQLLVVPSGALTALPFHLLVTEMPLAALPENFGGYRDAAWLIKRQAVTVLPSVASLKALRAVARKDQNSKPMIGFGDPVFDPDQNAGDVRDAAARPGTSKSAARNLTNAPYTDFWQGAGIDRGKLAQALPRLPDTADELKAVALKLGAPASDVHLGLDASETTLKRAPLADYGIVYFATHSLVAGDVKGLAEPSLALSIPRQPSELDDGLLTASEVAQLKLNADWVVLSACNTIAGDKPGAEALSGLARSFFYAGARALLVSHWAVDSAAATRLTVSTFDNLKSNPGIGRAEALRRAMLGYLNDASSPENAYPAFWGPFALIGEGAAR